MNKTNDSLIACLGWLIATIIGIAMTIVQGWVLTVLWGWFIVPTFGITQLSIPVAIGISFIVSMFRSHIPTNNKDESAEEKIGKIVGAILSPFFVLLFGWIVHSFM